MAALRIQDGRVRRAVNHSGSSDSAGAICCALLGARWGNAALPADWIYQLEGSETIIQVPEDLVRIARVNYRVTRTDGLRYPGV